VVMIVYDKGLERSLRARKAAFEVATRAAQHDWYEVDLTDTFATWLGGDEYREAYFESPEDLQLKLEAEFSDYVAERIRTLLTRSDVTSSSVVAVFGAGSLFGFARLSDVLSRVESHIQGRLLIFFPGHYEQSNYRLLDARDGWNYLAVPITLDSISRSSA
jgi:hypothetical protein